MIAHFSARSGGAGRNATSYFSARPAADGPFVTAGGRVLSVTGLGPTVADARRTAYEAVGRIRWDGAHYRRDIAEQAAGAMTVPTEAVR